MKIIDLRKRALVSEDGEGVLGYKDTGGHAWYMIYAPFAVKKKEEF